MHPKFINFSNHSSVKWSEKQLMAALQYGEIGEFPFPIVSPEMNADAVHKMADEYVKQLVNTFGAEITVHIMGEMTFTFMVVTRLKELGIRCVASTTERKTTYNADGTKLSEFSFVKFREY